MSATPEATPVPTPVVESLPADVLQFHADVLTRMDLALGVLVLFALVAGVVLVKNLW